MGFFQCGFRPYPQAYPCASEQQWSTAGNLDLADGIVRGVGSGISGHSEVCLARAGGAGEGTRYWSLDGVFSVPRNHGARDEDSAGA
jgi:hypothetical protein